VRNGLKNNSPQTRWAIYDAAIRLMVVKGYDKVKIEEICQEADVSSALFFTTFRPSLPLLMPI
jgi:AcrR family transcriptional regulator